MSERVTKFEMHADRIRARIAANKAAQEAAALQKGQATLQDFGIPSTPLAIDPFTRQPMAEYVAAQKQKCVALVCPDCQQEIKDFVYNWRSRWEGMTNFRYKCPACSPGVDARRAAKKQAEEQERAQANARRLFANANIPAMARGWRFDNLPAGHDAHIAGILQDMTRDNIDAILSTQEAAQAEDFDAFYSAPPVLSTFLYGLPGRAKTSLVVSAEHMYMGHGIQVLHMLASDYFRLLRSTFNTKESKYNKLEEMVHVVPVFTLDDVGVERGTAWELERLFSVIETRLSAGLVTNITSNLSLDVLMRKWHIADLAPEEMQPGERIIQRIEGNYEIYEVHGVNLRKRRSS
jgi:DNA replication protein DnaC